MYNKEPYIKDTIETVIRNHGVADNEFECILVDESSTDNSGRICMEYAYNYPYIRYYHIQNDGVHRPSNARNFGKSVAQGKYVMFLDADDDLLPEWEVNVLNWLDEHPDIDIWVGNYLIDKQVSIISTNIWRVIGPPCNVCVYKNEAIKAANFDNVPCEDVAQTKKLMMMGYKFHHDVVNPVIYRWYASRSTMCNMDADELNKYSDWTCGPALTLQYDDRYEFFVNDNKQLNLKSSKHIDHIDIICDDVNTVQQKALQYQEMRDDIRTMVLKDITVDSIELYNILDVVRCAFPNNEIKMVFGDSIMDGTFHVSQGVIKNNIICVFDYPTDNTFKRLIRNLIPKYFLRFEHE